MIRTSLLVLTLCAASLTLCFGQSSDLTAIAKGIGKYRSHLLLSNAEHREHLGKLVRKIERFKLNEEERQRLVFRLSNVPGPGEPIRQHYLLHLLGTFKPPIHPDSISATDLETLKANKDLYDLIGLGGLEIDYPFIVKPEFLLQHEYAFYDIRHKDRIAEIGAGNGEFSIVTAMIYDSLTMYVNELSPEHVEYIYRKANALHVLIQDDSLTILYGKETSAEIGKKCVDKIILRDVYHHFTAQKEMLGSMYDALADHGTLCVLEGTLNKNTVRHCYAAMTKRKIISTIENGGFVLIEQAELGRKTLFKFQKLSTEKQNQ